MTITLQKYSKGISFISVLVLLSTSLVLIMNWPMSKSHAMSEDRQVASGGGLPQDEEPSEEQLVQKLLNEFEDTTSASEDVLQLLAKALDDPKYSKKWYQIGRYLIFYGNDEKYYGKVMDFIFRRDVAVAPGDDLHTAYTAKVFLIGELGLLGDRYEDLFKKLITIEGASRLQEGWELSSLQLPKPIPREMPDYRADIMEGGIVGLALHPKQKHKAFLTSLYHEVHDEAESAILEQVTIDKENVFYTSPWPIGYFATIELSMLMLRLQDEMGWDAFLEFFKKDPSFEKYIDDIEDYLPQ